MHNMHSIHTDYVYIYIHHLDQDCSSMTSSFTHCCSWCACWLLWSSSRGQKTFLDWKAQKAQQCTVNSSLHGDKLIVPRFNHSEIRSTLWNPKFVAFEVPVSRFSVSLVDICHPRSHFSISCCILQSNLVQAGCARQQCPASTPWLHEYCRWVIPAGLFGIAMSTLGTFGVMPLTQVCNWAWLTCFILYEYWVTGSLPKMQWWKRCLEHMDSVPLGTPRWLEWSAEDFWMQICWLSIFLVDL